MDNVNFLPEDYVEKKAQQRTNVVCLTLFFLVVAGVAGGLMVCEKRQRSMNLREEAVKQKYVQATESLKQMEQLKKNMEQMMQKASTSQSLMEKVPRSLLLATVTNALPSGVSLLDLELVSKVERPKSNKKGRSRAWRNKKRGRAKKAEMTEEKPGVKSQTEKTSIEIEGLAATDLQVAKLISNLNESTLFSQVNLEFSEEHEVNEEVLRRFKLRIHLDPKARASEEDVALARQAHVTGL